MLICAALSDKPCKIHCADTNDDIDATVSCLQALGAKILRENGCFIVSPILSLPEEATLDCRESGSTLRFLLPLSAALGISTTFILEGRLKERPLSPLWEELERMGCRLQRTPDNNIQCSGKLLPGDYKISGDISSQFITGLLLALSILHGDSTLSIIEPIQSRPYIDITKSVLSFFGVNTDSYPIHGQYPLNGPHTLSVEGDWSNAAFFLVANALGSNIRISGLNTDSIQGDREIVSHIKESGQMVVIDVAQIPDLMPVLSVYFAANKGAVFTNIQRLRLKESDRVSAVRNMLHNMGIHTEETNATLTVYPGKLQGCTVNSNNDHRIAMSAAIAATIAEGPITITNAQCVNKSYPSFWEDIAKLGGIYELLEG